MRMTLFALMACTAALAAGIAWPDDDHVAAYRLRQDREILPLEEILARADIPPDARILEVEHEVEHGRHIYEIEYVAAEGRIVEVEVDARTGEVLQREED